MTSKNTITFSVFTKPWKMEVAALGDFVAGLGFDAIELPVRPGFQVESENVAKGLAEAARIMAEHGVRIGVQNHCGRYVNNAMGLLHLIEHYDPKHVAAVWDAAHNALHGAMTQLKNPPTSQ